jgi:hypothetical protein
VKLRADGFGIVWSQHDFSAELLAALERSGMRRITCAGCGKEGLTRTPAGGVDRCPWCEEKARKDPPA